MNSHTELIDLAIRAARFHEAAKRLGGDDLTWAEHNFDKHKAALDQAISTLTAEVAELARDLAAFPCQTKSNDDAESGCCGPCRARKAEGLATQKVNDAWNAALEKGREEARATLTKGSGS